ncbi:BZ3500_MvSof-1268-A1-R1_Chr9g10404 [Microbotryum saponariae]|uniref:BZ3500_MvSof-1268-A1-R1_Chr9g10404 protein n=1 Tax=Microbotryum saponariae TaxID=289078 RepID=A0A2X0LUG1_9BASI|nr:BZ3501_MvSof-1269-A2-R1_Chr9g10154 [Microbotryum saponariae]SDA00035.1 BZ3500_MvSof-1268-A1-R1_Chr9g10404 [Microbotryum saponariae]
MSHSFHSGEEEKNVLSRAETGSIPVAKDASSDKVVAAHGQVVALHGPFAKVMTYLADRGVEARGLDRVPEDERIAQSGLQIFFFWMSVNLSFSSLAVGGLGSEYFGLDFRTSLAVIWTMAVVGCLATAYVATLGLSGLRTMALFRFAGGIPGTFICSLLNVLTQLSYSVTNALAGAQAFHAINHSLSLIVGIVVVSSVVFVLSIFGLAWVHRFARYCWIACFIIYCIILGLGTRGGYDVNRLTAQQATGKSLSAGILSFAGIMFSVASGWGVIAADYNVTLPADTPKWRVFFFTFFGTFLPIVFTCTVSATFQTITNPSYIAAFESDSLGGIVGAILGPIGGFGKFLLVLLGLSTIASNAPNTYSGSLAMQSLAPPLLKIPRIFFVVLFTAIYLIASIVGREHFSEIVANFASILSYWTAFFIVILLLEFEWFRRPSGPLGRPDFDSFNDWKRLPPGFACVGAIAIAIGGIVPAMAQTYYTGPIAKAVEPVFGGDLGFEMSVGLSLVAYFVLRSIEVRVFKR